MFQKNASGWYKSTILSNIEGLVHGFSTRAAGDMRSEENRKQFFQKMGVSESLFVMPEQVHGTKVMIVSQHDEVKGADALVHGRSLKGVALKGSPFILGVRVADCIPLLFVDPVTNVIGIAHAGWRGTLGGIARNVVRSMVALGARQGDILVALGPHIGMCCYNVAPDRAGQFARMFASDPRIVSPTERGLHLDLGYANVRQLRDAGIPADHIDAAITCTSCQVDTFYSYRKDTSATFGEMLGVIGYEH